MLIEVEVREVCKNIKIDITPEQSKLVEELTRGQSTSKLWFRYRAGRITASKMKSCCNAKAEDPSESLIKSICYPSATSFKSPATTWGCVHEAEAMRHFTKKQQLTHVNFSVETAGFYISSEFPYIGASPDGIASCDCCCKRVIEIKCPYCLRDKNLNDAPPNYLKTDSNGNKKLDTKHAYYYQVQTQLGVCGLKSAYFVVWNRASMHIENIELDLDHWQHMVGRAELLFSCVILPELVGKLFSMRRHLSRLIKNHSQRICYCDSEIGDFTVITCEGPKCEIKHFHQACVFYDEDLGDFQWYCPDCR